MNSSSSHNHHHHHHHRRRLLCVIFSRKHQKITRRQIYFRIFSYFISHSSPLIYNSIFQSITRFQSLNNVYSRWLNEKPISIFPFSSPSLFLFSNAFLLTVYVYADVCIIKYFKLFYFSYIRVHTYVHLLFDLDLHIA